MQPFKFLSKNNSTPAGRIWGGTDVNGITFNNGDFIIRTNSYHLHNHNVLRIERNIPLDFWWKDNYEHFELLNERPLGIGIIETYEGTIGRFLENYNHRRMTNRLWFYSDYPVLTQIECNGSIFRNQDIHFNNNDMWVLIRYLIFVNR